MLIDDSEVSKEPECWLKNLDKMRSVQLSELACDWRVGRNINEKLVSASKSYS
jgi:hypothetical protein